MFLNFFDSIREFFKILVSKVSWGSIFLLLTGIVIGFVIAGFFIVIIMLKNIKKTDSKSVTAIEEEDIVKSREIENLIAGTKDQFFEESETYTTNQKIALVKDLSWQLINNIAKIYYPDSKYPIYELSVEELISLNYYITERIEKIFDGKILKMAKTLKISKILTIIDTKKKIEDSKIVKASKNIYINSIKKIAFSALNMVNPVYWLKKAIMNASVNIGINKISTIIIEIVGQETAKVYSKNLFNVDTSKIEEELDNITKELEENGGI